MFFLYLQIFSRRGYMVFDTFIKDFIVDFRNKIAFFH